MLTVLAVLVFGGGLALSLYAMIATIAPATDQIRAALTGRPYRAFAPLATLAQAERRIAVRRWAATPARPLAIRRAAA